MGKNRILSILDYRATLCDLFQCQRYRAQYSEYHFEQVLFHFIYSLCKQREPIFCFSTLKSYFLFIGSTSSKLYY